MLLRSFEGAFFNAPYFTNGNISKNSLKEKNMINFNVNNPKEINKIISFLYITFKEDGEYSYDMKMYNDVLSIIDDKINLIAHEMHLIMNSSNHPDNFLPDTEAWEIYRDSLVNGSTMFEGLLDEQLFKLATKVSSRLDPNYVKAMVYFYRDDLDYHGFYSEEQILIDELFPSIEKRTLIEIQRHLSDIAETEQTLEWEQDYELCLRI